MSHKKITVSLSGTTVSGDNYYLALNYAPESDVDKRTILMRFVFTQAMIIHVKDLSKMPALPFAT